MPMIYETIVTTLDSDNQPHIAPFGVRDEGELVLIAPFRPSSSLDNFLHHQTAVINLTDDVRIFAGAFVGRCDWPLVAADKISGVRLASALAHKELELVEVRENATRPELLFKVKYEVQHQAFRGFNRAQAAVIELAVLVSRLHMLPMEKIEEEITYLTIAVKKTAGERESQAWQWLIEHIENHKAQLNMGNIA